MTNNPTSAIPWRIFGTWTIRNVTPGVRYLPRGNIYSEMEILALLLRFETVRILGEQLMTFRTERNLNNTEHTVLYCTVPYHRDSTAIYRALLFGGTNDPMHRSRRTFLCGGPDLRGLRPVINTSRAQGSEDQNLLEERPAKHSR